MQYYWKDVSPKWIETISVGLTLDFYSLEIAYSFLLPNILLKWAVSKALSSSGDFTSLGKFLTLIAKSVT